MEQLHLERLREFVALYQDIPDLQFKDPPQNMDLKTHQGVTYLLMAASINQTTTAESVRSLMHYLFKIFKDRVFETEEEEFRELLNKIKDRTKSKWKMYDHGPRVLASVLRFSRQHPDLVQWGRKQASPEAAVEYLAQNIYYFGKNPEGARKKAWMFLRWMVRPHPDLGIWQSPTMQPAGLKIPLDVNIGRAFLDITRKSALKERFDSQKKRFTMDLDKPRELASDRHNVELVTEVARWIFPEDPARVDYAFFTYGRKDLPPSEKDRDRCSVLVGCHRCPIKEVVKCLGVRN